MDMSGEFNTKMTPEKEGDYQLWLADQSKARGRDMSKDHYDYDMRGYFNAGKGLNETEGHFPDTFKKPNHPTFSNESQYHGAPKPGGGRYLGGSWNGDTFIPPK